MQGYLAHKKPPPLPGPLRTLQVVMFVEIHQTYLQRIGPSELKVAVALNSFHIRPKQTSGPVDSALGYSVDWSKVAALLRIGAWGGA